MKRFDELPYSEKYLWITIAEKECVGLINPTTMLPVDKVKYAEHLFTLEQRKSKL